MEHGSPDNDPEPFAVPALTHPSNPWFPRSEPTDLHP